MLGSMKRILQVIPTLDRGGAEKQLTLLATGLPRDHVDVHVCLLTRAGPLQPILAAHEIPVHEIHKSWKIDPGAYWRLRRYIRELRPDLVHTWLFAANSYGRQAAIAAGVPHLVAGERCADRWKARHEFTIDRHLARRTDRLVTNSSGVRDFYVEHGLPEEKFEIIPNGIACRAQPHQPAPTGTLRNEIGVDGAARIIGCVGRLWPQKRQKDLIWAAHILDELRGDVHLVLVGDGPQRWRLERYARQLEFDHRTHFLGERADVAPMLPQFDCVWLGSGYEGQSNAILEAMAAGRPVVATDIPGNRDLVVPETTGYLVPVGDAAAFAHRTHAILEDETLCKRLGAAGHERVLHEFSVTRMVERHLALYDNLI